MQFWQSQQQIFAEIPEKLYFFKPKNQLSPKKFLDT